MFLCCLLSDDIARTQEVIYSSFFKLLARQVSSTKYVCMYFLCSQSNEFHIFSTKGGCCGRDHMVVGFTTTYANIAYHH
jgi:hypothetical protein